MQLYMQFILREGIYESSEVVPVMQLFFLYAWHIAFSRNMEYIYLLEVDVFPDVVFVEAEVIHYRCCDVFWPIYAGMVVVLEFGWKGLFNVL